MTANKPYVNLYAPPASGFQPAPGQDLYGSEPYDINFCLPFESPLLKSDHVELVPFIPRLHADAFLRAQHTWPEMYRWMPVPVYRDIEECLASLELFFRKDPNAVLFAVFDRSNVCMERAQAKVAVQNGPGLMGLNAADATDGEVQVREIVRTKDEREPDAIFVGLIALLYTSAPNLKTEIGPVLVFPPFQRTHVASHMTCLLLRYCLTPSTPSFSPPGLGMRRVQWTTHPSNEASKRTAKRLGMKFEGEHRWIWVLPPGAEDHTPSESDSVQQHGRHSHMFAVCWDDWDQGARDKVQSLLERDIIPKA